MEGLDRKNGGLTLDDAHYTACETLAREFLKHEGQRIYYGKPYVSDPTTYRIDITLEGKTAYMDITAPSRNLPNEKLPMIFAQLQEPLRRLCLLTQIKQDAV